MRESSSNTAQSTPQTDFQLPCSGHCARKREYPCQAFTNRSDKAGGSTLGNISNSHVAVNTVDIGLPQLSMHSPYETVGIKDTCYLIRAARRFYSTSMKAMGSGSYEVR